MADANRLVEHLQSRFGDTLTRVASAVDEVTVDVRPADLLDVARALRDEDVFSFEQLIDLCGVDYLLYGEDEWTTEASTTSGFSRGVAAHSSGRLGVTVEEPWEGEDEPEAFPGRYAAVVHLLSVSKNQRLRLRTFCEDDDFPVVPSLTGVWASANWFEREAYDLYGILFEGHPDLRRILTDYGFVGHPFRKDFPLIGNVEVRYDANRQRVVYEPTSIEPRVLVPRVIRASRALQGEHGEPLNPGEEKV